MVDALAVLLLSSLACQGLQLGGTVRGPDGPLAGATVYVSTARPRVGTSVL